MKANLKIVYEVENGKMLCEITKNDLDKLISNFAVISRCNDTITLHFDNNPQEFKPFMIEVKTPIQAIELKKVLEGVTDKNVAIDTLWFQIPEKYRYAKQEG